MVLVGCPEMLPQQRYEPGAGFPLAFQCLQPTIDRAFLMACIDNNTLLTQVLGGTNAAE